MATLRITGGPAAGRTIPVDREISIGRENVDVVIDDPEMSRRHAIVRIKGALLEIEDAGSANGTFVDDQRIAGAIVIGGGSKIRMGTTVLAVEGLLPAQGTRLSAAVGAQPTRAAPVPEPQVTRATPMPPAPSEPVAQPQPTRARAVPDPQVTRARAIPEPQPTRERPVAEPQPTRPGAVPQPPQPTRARAVPPRGAAPPAAPPPAAPPSPRPRPGAGTGPIGQFQPPTRPRSRGLASRSWVPVVLSYGSVILVAIALVIYFAAR